MLGTHRNGLKLGEEFGYCMDLVVKTKIKLTNGGFPPLLIVNKLQV